MVMKNLEELKLRENDSGIYLYTATMERFSEQGKCVTKQV